MPREIKPKFHPDYIRDVSEKVYRLRLDDASGGGADAVKRMLEQDADGGVKLRNRAAQYDALTRTYLKALGSAP